jgi:RNA polymerase sigma-54 factor
MLLQRHVTSTRPLTTAHLAQTMTLLGLTAVELRQKIESELASNPALELVEERRCPHCRRLLPGGAHCPVCSRPKGVLPEQPIVFVSPREDFYNYSGMKSEGQSEDSYSLTPEEEDLPQFVLKQIAPELSQNDRLIAAHILTGLNEDGLLSIPLVEIARYNHVPLSRVQQVLHLIQRAEPVGVGSPSTKEALLVQLEVLSETNPVPELAFKAIQNGMELLSRRRYLELGVLLGISTSKTREIAKFIANNLHPYPGRTHWGEINYPNSQSETRKNIFYYPDIIISKQNDSENTPLIVEIAMPIWGTLRVNPLFKEAINDAPPEKAEHWKADIDRAVLLVKCLQQRNHTIVRLMERLTVLQRKYILNGSAHLHPYTRASISRDLNVHESTISRAVSGKAVQLPNGHIVALATFFDRSLHIRTALKTIVDHETHPLSDTEIGELLAGQGHNVARRTVAKYRSMEGILPAHLRSPVQPTGA